MVIKILKDAQLNGAEVPIYCCGVPWSPTKSHDSTQMVAPVQEFLMYLASSRASSLQISFTGGAGFYGYFYGLFYVFTDADQFHGFLIGSFTNMEYSHILCVF